MIYLENEQEILEVTKDFENQLKKVIDFALKEEKVTIPYEVSVLIVDNDTIRGINNENRGIDKATDVLSFPQLNYPEKKVFKDVYLNHKFAPYELDEDKLILGDIVLSLERAEEQGIEYGHSFERECFYLVVHSVLHLLGYDHMKDDEKTVMRKREEEILLKLNITR